jgi:hypothetical protein
LKHNNEYNVGDNVQHNQEDREVGNARLWCGEHIGHKVGEGNQLHGEREGHHEGHALCAGSGEADVVVTHFRCAPRDPHNYQRHHHDHEVCNKGANPVGTEVAAHHGEHVAQLVRALLHDELGNQAGGPQVAAHVDGRCHLIRHLCILGDNVQSVQHCRCDDRGDGHAHQRDGHEIVERVQQLAVADGNDL